MMKAVHLCPVGDGKIRYIHEIRDFDICLSCSSTFISNAVEVELKEWARRAAAAGLDPTLHEFFRILWANGNWYSRRCYVLVIPTCTLLPR